jgi:general secretion pathway protein C
MNLLLVVALLNVEAVARLLNLSLQERKVVPARLPLKLHGTMIAHEPRFSLALIDRRSVFVGDEVEGLTVRSISRGCVVLDAPDETSSQELCMQPRAADPARESRAPGELHAALTDFAKWTSVRVVPVPNGFKLFNVPPHSIYEQLGIQSGDIVRKLNGRPVDFSLLPLVHPGAHLAVELERNGQPYVLEGQLD